MAEVVNTGHELVEVDRLVPHPQNPRRGDVDLIRESIRANGFYGQVVVQVGSNRILAGEHRWRAAVAEGLTVVPVTWVDVDDATALRILLADNRANDVAGYDDRSLVALLESLLVEDPQLVGTGFGPDDLNLMLAALASVEPSPPEQFPTYDETLATEHACPRCGYTWSGSA